MKVKEIMIRDVKSISPDTNAWEALELLEQLHISGLPVINKNSELVGMFTEKDILTHVLPSYIQAVGKFVYVENPKATKKKFQELTKIKVSQIMRKEVISVSEDTTLCEVVRIMLTQKARRLPVLNKEGRVSGIVARCDVLKALAIESGLQPS